VTLESDRSSTSQRTREGLLAALISYTLWGFLPIYFKVVETVPVFYIDNQMRSGKFFAVTLTKVVFTILLRHMRAADGMLFFRLGGA